MHLRNNNICALIQQVVCLTKIRYINNRLTQITSTCDLHNITQNAGKKILCQQITLKTKTLLIIITQGNKTENFYTDTKLYTKQNQRNKYNVKDQQSSTRLLHNLKILYIMLNYIFFFHFLSQLIGIAQFIIIINLQKSQQHTEANIDLEQVQYLKKLIPNQNFSRTTLWNNKLKVPNTQNNKHKNKFVSQIQRILKSCRVTFNLV
eukprot:TRINITY_DN2935_c2_g2_i1.p2 TRINITY_DN2935_c2_g2~~TRINITY_DN2935_c2_g2_i1.p2  ORF type:complete len:206 (-),score=-13.88 TRINITY_DN2935_c2_g2_i1:1941-2558(-)